MKEKLSKEFLHLPLYAWLAGGAALVLSILYFRSRSTSSVTATGTPANAAQQGSYPQNIYNSTSVYSQLGSVPGSTAKAPPPAVATSVLTGMGGFRPVPPILSSTGNFPPGYGQNPGPGLQPLSPANTGGALMPAPVNPVNWRPATNTSIFGQGAGQTAPVSPVTAWTMTPTGMYTQN